jgi:hypothetical protein
MRYKWIALTAFTLLLACNKPVETGSVEINSTPTGADVYLDDSLTGMKTNCVLEELPLGVYRITLELDGYYDWIDVVRLTEDSNLVVINAELTDTTQSEPGTVTGLKAEGTTDGLGINLTWDILSGADSYNVYLDGVLMLDEITINEYTHYPEETGSYTVTANTGDNEGPESEPLSTEPIITDPFMVSELNGMTAGGIGWDAATGIASAYSMADVSYQYIIDCYFTNWSSGFSGVYDLASPVELENDEGNTWLPTTGWRESGISEPLSESFENVRYAPEVGYYPYASVVINAVNAVWNEDDYFALIEVQDIDIGAGQITIRTAFQPIKGFRLF